MLATTKKHKIERITDIAFEVRYISQALITMQHRGIIDNEIGNELVRELRRTATELSAVINTPTKG